MTSKVKQMILNALVDSFDMTERDAEERILGGEEIDGGIGEELMEEELGEEFEEYEVCGLSLAGHSYDLNVSADGEFYSVFLVFRDSPDLEEVDGAFERYSSSSASERLRIENDIESSEDMLMLSYEVDGDLQECLSDIFKLLESEECIQLVNEVLL